MAGHWSDFLDPEAPTGRYIDWAEVEHSAGLSRTTAWRLRQIGEFPDPYALSAGRVGYRELEIEAWKRWRTQHRSRGGARPVGRAPRPGAVEGLRPAPSPPAPLEEPRTVPPPPAPEPPRALPLFAAAPAEKPRPLASRTPVAGGQISFEF